MAFEKRWEAIPLVLFTANGTVDGVVTLMSVARFRVKQTVYIQSNTQATIVLEVKRILSHTQLLVGPQNTSLHTVQDISTYLVADSAGILANIQPRPSIPYQEHERAVYEEEPVVARRAFLVDEFGDPIDDNNPLPTTAIAGDNSPENVVIYRVPYPTANVEVSQLLPNNTRKLYVGISDMSGKMRVSFQLNGTITSGGNSFTTIQVGNSYFREGLNLIGKTVYYQTTKAGVTVEIEAWV